MDAIDPRHLCHINTRHPQRRFPVIPTKAGIHQKQELDPRFHGDDTRNEDDKQNQMDNFVDVVNFVHRILEREATVPVEALRAKPFNLLSTERIGLD